MMPKLVSGKARLLIRILITPVKKLQGQWELKELSIFHAPSAGSFSRNKKAIAALAQLLKNTHTHTHTEERYRQSQHTWEGNERAKVSAGFWS